MSNNFINIVAWIKDNQLMMGLIASAVIGTMPETLPGFRAFPQWLWTWLREASKTFLNFKKGVPDPIVSKISPTLPVIPKTEGPQQLNG